MHELAIAQGILQIVREQEEKKGFSRVLEIRLKIGEFSGILPDCLLEFFPVAAKGTSAEGAALHIESVPARFRCPACGYEGAADRKNACCPACGSTAIQMTAGRELFVENLKVE